MMIGRRPDYTLIALIVVSLIITALVLIALGKTDDLYTKVGLGLAELSVIVFFIYAGYKIRNVIEQVRK